MDGHSQLKRQSQPPANPEESPGDVPLEEYELLYCGYRFTDFNDWGPRPSVAKCADKSDDGVPPWDTTGSEK